MIPPVEQPIRLRILSQPCHLPVVRAAIEKLCQLVGFDAAAAGQIILCVDEALTNIIRHAYKGAGDRPIEIELTPTGSDPTPDGLRICLRDYGPPLDPSTIPARDLDDVRPGGLGAHIMNQCMDQVEYRPADGGGTVLILVRKLICDPCKDCTE